MVTDRTYRQGLGRAHNHRHRYIRSKIKKVKNKDQRKPQQKEKPKLDQRSMSKTILKPRQKRRPSTFIESNLAMNAILDQQSKQPTPILDGS